MWTPLALAQFAWKSSMSQQRTTKRRSAVPSHLPRPWPDQQAYDDFYREVNPYQDYSENDGPWQEIRFLREAPPNKCIDACRRGWTVNTVGI